MCPSKDHSGPGRVATVGCCPPGASGPRQVRRTVTQPSGTGAGNSGEGTHVRGATCPSPGSPSLSAGKQGSTGTKGPPGLVAVAGLRSGGGWRSRAVPYPACDPSPGRQPGPRPARGFRPQGPSLRRAEQGLGIESVIGNWGPPTAAEVRPRTHPHPHTARRAHAGQGGLGSLRARPGAEEGLLCSSPALTPLLCPLPPPV